MKTCSRRVANLAVAMLLLFQVPLIVAAETKTVPAAPIPPQILAAKKIFIANAGQDEMFMDEPHFSGDPERAYNQFYAAIKNSGRYEIVSSPAEADLLLEIELDVSEVALGGKAGSSFTPVFRVRIRDPRSHAMLWAFSLHVEFGLGQANSDRNFDQGVSRLVAHVLALTVPAPSGGPTP